MIYLVHCGATFLESDAFRKSALCEYNSVWD